VKKVVIGCVVGAYVFLTYGRVVNATTYHPKEYVVPENRSYIKVAQLKKSTNKSKYSVSVYSVKPVINRKDNFTTVWYKAAIVNKFGNWTWTKDKEDNVEMSINEKQNKTFAYKTGGLKLKKGVPMKVYCRGNNDNYRAKVDCLIDIN